MLSSGFERVGDQPDIPALDERDVSESPVGACLCPLANAGVWLRAAWICSDIVLVELDKHEPGRAQAPAFSGSVWRRAG